MSTYRVYVDLGDFPVPPGSDIALRVSQENRAMPRTGELRLKAG